MIDFDVTGTADTLRELGRIDPELRKQALGSMKQALEPLAAAARAYVPAEAPLSGMTHRSRLQWRGARPRTSIRATVSTKRRGTEIPLARIVQSDPAGAMWDMAGKRGGTTPKGRQMIASMTARNGNPSRSMWRAESVYRQDTETALAQAVAEVEATLSRALGGA